MRIGIAHFWHESNSFSSALTDADDFEKFQGGVVIGDSILRRHDERDEVTGFIDVLQGRADVEIVPLVIAGALPSGLITTAAAAMLESALRESLAAAGRLDGVCIAPHGAMAAEGIDDFDGHLLQVVRQHVGRSAVVVSALDCHAVVTRAMVDLSTAVVAYRTHPHVDRVETGRRAAGVLLDALDGRTRPVTRVCRVPMLFPPRDEGTTGGALKDLFDTFIAWDGRPGVIACSLCPAFAWQDVPQQSMCAVAVTDGDPALAQQLADELAAMTWKMRSRFEPDPMISIDEAMRQASRIEGCPVVITDSADTVGGGAPGDNTALLEGVLKHRSVIDGLILAHLPDAPAIDALRSAKVGDTVSVEVGGKRDTRFCKPLAITGRIACTTQGPIDDDFGAATTPTLETGPIVCVAIDNVRLVLSERVIMGPQQSLFRRVGIEPFEAKVVTLKTGVGFKKAFAKVAAAVLRADCPGAESYNLSRYTFERIPRPIYPLDGDFDWRPGTND